MPSALELVAIVATAFFGIFGSLADFRNSRGNITLKGWIALVGILLASSTLGALQIYSKMQEEQTSRALLDKNTTILSDINRGLNPLRGLETNVLLTADWSIGRLRSYFSALESSFHHERSFGTLSLPRASCEDGEIPSKPASDTESAPDFPEQLSDLATVPCETSQVIYDVFCSMDLILLFYKDPLASYDIEYRGVGRNHAEDLRIYLDSPCRFAPIYEEFDDSSLTFTLPGSDANLEYDLREGKLHRLDFAILHDQEAAYRRWRGNSKIISLHDLLGAQLVIHVASIGVVSEETRLLMDKVSLRQLVLKLPDGIMLSLNDKNLAPHKTGSTHASYSIVFPDDLEQLLAVTRYDPFALLD